MYFSYTPRRFRFLSWRKMGLLTVPFSSLVIYLMFFHQRNKWCDPAEHLWWFCSWPGSETICSWNSHFPTIEENIRSPKFYDNQLSSLPIVQSAFVYNNATLSQCSEPSIDILLFLMSKCSHFSIRQAIRRTWGNIHVLAQYFPQVKLKVLFLVDLDSQSKMKIELEHRINKDIVQVVSLPEQYELVTHREAALYTFVKMRCYQAKFIFKTDDDIFINTFMLMLAYQRFEILSNRSVYSLFGFPIEHGLVIRHSSDEVGSRYVITDEEYSCPRYPTFLSGFGYLMPFRTCSLLVKAYERDQWPFPLSDVYFTGLLAQMMNIHREKLFDNVDYRYKTQCDQQFFTMQNKQFACAANNDHFKQNGANEHSSLMSDYNLYWTVIKAKYNAVIVSNQT